MKRVINFSGGKTSAMMTILNYREGDLVIFADTGREHPKTYKFINDFEAHEEVEESLSLEDREKELIQKALEKHRGKRKYAAAELGISERTLYRKIKEYNLME